MICTQLGKNCPKEFLMSWNWDNDKEEEDQVKSENDDKNNENETPELTPNSLQ